MAATGLFLQTQIKPHRSTERNNTKLLSQLDDDEIHSVTVLLKDDKEIHSVTKLLKDDNEIHSVTKLLKEAPQTNRSWR